MTPADQSSQADGPRPAVGAGGVSAGARGDHTEVTRLAPSPTGALHLGNARTFIINWAVARRAGWRIVMRIEDLDGPRNKPGADRDALETLAWLGLDWDGGPLRQTDDLAPYTDAMRSLAARGLVYPCELTRSQIEAAASAPQQDRPAEGPGSLPAEVRFPPELRPRERPATFNDPAQSWRMVVPDIEVAFDDDFAGPQCRCPARTVGDVVVWTKRAEPAYQLAVVVDDHRQGVTRVVRGDDLLDSAARQLLIYRALGYAPEPRHMHLPLVVGTDGRRLAKRHGDSRLAHYRERGVRPERIVGLLAGWCGLARAEMTAAQFAAALDVATIPRSPITFTPEDDAWLLGQ